jgi:hypothetical protein
MSLVETFCDVDDFCQKFEPRWKRFQLQSGMCQRNRKGNLSLSEIMTIMIHFHQSGYRTFKDYYVKYVQKYLSLDGSLICSLSFLSTQQKRHLHWYFFCRFNTNQGLQE